MCVSQRRFLLGSIVVVFLLSGCGYNTGSGAPPPSGGTPTPPPTSSVSLQVGATSYPLGSVISVTIKNQSGQTIFFADHLTNCTVLLLQRQVANSWEPIALCKLSIATHIHSSKAGESLEVKLTSSEQWPTGTYRARLDYGAGSQAGLGAPKTVYSSEFHVG
jgi:hypothetical protein